MSQTKLQADIRTAGKEAMKAALATNPPEDLTQFTEEMAEEFGKELGTRLGLILDAWLAQATVAVQTVPATGTGTGIITPSPAVAPTTP